MSNMPVWFKLIHYWCREKKPKGFGLTIPFIIGAGEGGLKYYDETIEVMESIDDVITYLKKRYFDCIKNKAFSKNKTTKKWQGYTDEDLSIIKTVLSR